MKKFIMVGMLIVGMLISGEAEETPEQPERHHSQKHEVQ